MCMHGKIRIQMIPKESAITAYKLVKKWHDGSGYCPPFVSGDNYKRGVSVSERPGFHACLERKDAIRESDNYYVVIKVALWGRVRFGKQWDSKCASATHMEIKSFENIARKHS
jgi:hypothetical protein